MLPRLGELLIEDLLLFRRQHAANLAEALPEQDMPLMIEVAPRLHHLEPRIAQDVADAIVRLRSRFIRSINSGPGTRK
jgi:hypothetical protein